MNSNDVPEANLDRVGIVLEDEDLLTIDSVPGEESQRYSFEGEGEGGKFWLDAG